MTSPGAGVPPPADDTAQFFGEAAVAVVMGLAIRQASLGFVDHLNRLLASPWSTTTGECALLLLLFLFIGLGADFLLWMIPLAKRFSIANVLWSLASATLTLLLIELVAHQDFTIGRGVYAVVFFGIAIPAIHFYNFGFLMKAWLAPELRQLKLVINPVIAVLSIVLGVVWRFAPTDGFFLTMVILFGIAFAIYAALGWYRLFKTPRS